MRAGLKTPESREEALGYLVRTVSEEIQLELREYMRGERYFGDIEEVYLANPFLKLTEEEVAYFSKSGRHDHIASLILVRDAAARSTAPKYNVCCMPKSGSSFVRTALQHALQIPSHSLTSAGKATISSIYGMNSREQEIDEYALIKAILSSPQGFVTQNHTRYSQYLGLQMRYFKMTPIVTIRNILDCVVSFDDMMRAWREGRGIGGWTNDAQFALPLNYPELDDAVRFDLLAKTYGVWLVNFFVSWKRCTRQPYVTPIFVRYEDHVLNPERLLELISSSMPVTDEQLGRLEEYARSPDREKSRLNVGVAGRGRERIPESSVELLLDYARRFVMEIDDDEVAYLLR